MFQDESDRAVWMPTSSVHVWSPLCWPAVVRAYRHPVCHSWQPDQQNRTPAHPKGRHMLRQATVIHETCNREALSQKIILSHDLLAHRVTEVEGCLPEVRHLGPASVLDSSMKIKCAHVVEHERLNLVRWMANSVCFPFNSFMYYLTFFWKFFSSFCHGTCWLSVLCLYLGLDGVYHPFWVAILNNPTLGKHIADDRTLPCTGLSPSMMCCSKQFRQSWFIWKVLLETTIHHSKQWRFQTWAVHSSFTITVGILVSFSSSA